VTENPQDEPRNEEEEAAAPAEPEGAPETEAAAESAESEAAAPEAADSEAVAPEAAEPEAAEPEAAEPEAAEPEAPAPEAAEPEAAEPQAAVPEPAEPQAAGPEPAPAPAEAAPAAEAAPEAEAAPAAEAEAAPAADAAPAAEVPQAQAGAEDEDEEIELTPREKPEIPGADLIPDIIPEGDQFLDAEAQAAAEAEAEAAAALAEQESEDEDARPIADAAIDLAAGARYTATGKRKTAVARVILKPGTGTYSINDKALEAFFPRETLQRMIRQPLEAVGYESRMDVIARMHGGGVSAQAGALRHGVSRALIEADPNLRGELKRRGFLTRDPRVKERKKAGLKKARKRPQFSKR
jgi:small subunit ribosomal protein S9